MMHELNPVKTRPSDERKVYLVCEGVYNKSSGSYERKGEITHWAEMPAKRSRVRWIDPRVQTPTEDEPVLIMCHQEGQPEPEVTMGFWDEGSWHECYGDVVEPTAWAPLPEGPK